MLVLTRKTNESINIGDDIEVFIVEIKDDHVKLGIKAPKAIPVYRQEIYRYIREENDLAAATSEESLESASEILAKSFPKKI